MKNKTLVISLVLALFFLIGAVSAVDDTNVSQSDVDDVISQADQADEVVSSDNQNDEPVALDKQTDDVMSQDSGEDKVISSSVSDKKVLSSTNKEVKSDDKPIKTVITKADATVIKGKYYKVSLVDKNGTGLAGKTLSIKFNGVTSKVKTDSNGVAKLKINAQKGKYKIKFAFKGDKNYQGVSASRNMLVIQTKNPKIVGSNYVAYVGVKNSYVVRLTVGGVPLYNREVVFTLNGKDHMRKTNSKGYASMTVKKLQTPGTYRIGYYYGGEPNVNGASGSSKLTIKKGMPVKISKANSVVYMHRMSAPFKVKVVDGRGKVMPNAKVFFVVKHKTYAKKTNKKGIASLTIKLGKGSYKVKVYTKKNSTHKKAQKTWKIKVRARGPIHNGVWLFASDMKKVNLKGMAKYHVNQIFVNQICLDWYGKSYVQSFCKAAGKYGIKVHIWMQVCYWGSWKYPVYKDGKYNYKFINSKVKQAVKFAKIKGVDGVHFDYVRFPGNAYQYKNAAAGITLFVKKATAAIHKVNKKTIVSAALMPEPDSMRYYYGQDITQMSKYLDVLIPMVYKGNYLSGTNWIKQMTKIFVKKSKKAQVWTGLQSYGSDSNVVRLSASELKGDSISAAKGGATGIIFFRHGLLNYFDFNKITV